MNEHDASLLEPGSRWSEPVNNSLWAVSFSAYLEDSMYSNWGFPVNTILSEVKCYLYNFLWDEQNSNINRL